MPPDWLSSKKFSWILLIEETTLFVDSWIASTTFLVSWIFFSVFSSNFSIVSLIEAKSFWIIPSELCKISANSKPFDASTPFSCDASVWLKKESRPVRKNNDDEKTNAHLVLYLKYHHFLNFRRK